MTSNSELRKILKYIKFMKVTENLASLSYDPKHQVGSIIVDKNFSNICAIGYNGNFPGGDNKRDSLESGNSGFLHAEENLLIRANLLHSESYILFVTMTPCHMCSKRIAIKRDNIKEVIALKPYGDHKSQEVLLKTGINFYFLEDKIFSLYKDTELFEELFDLIRDAKRNVLELSLYNLLYLQIDKFLEFNKEGLANIPNLTISINDDDENLEIIKKYFKAFYTALYKIL